MGIFEIQHPDGRTFEVDAPSLEQAAAAMGHGAAPQPQESDPIRRQVRGELESDRAKGIPGSEAGYADRLLHGATLGAADEIMAAGATPFEMFRRGTWSPAEGYRYAKARQDLMLEDARKAQGLPGDIAEIAGGVGSGIGLARGGVTLARQGAGLLRNTLGMGAEGAAYGGVTGFNEGNSLDERVAGAGRGAAIGTGIGLATPAAGAILSHTVAPLASAARAMVNPQGVAERQFARSLSDSGLTAQEVSDRVAQAAQDGQGVFTAADAMGHSGQRALSTVARAPGEGRQQVVDFLDNRQAGQGRRVANIISEGLDAPVTAAQARTRMEGARDAAADNAYGAVRDDAGPVNVSNVIAHIDQTLRPGVNQIVNPGANLAPDSVEAALAGVRSRLTDGRSQLTDFDSLQRVRGDLADAISRAHRAGEGNKVRLLTGVREQMDRSMETASEGFRNANADFARRSRAIDAIDTGTTAAQRGRVEDTIPEFRAMTPAQQAAYRVGYAEPLIAQAQGGAVGVNKARPLTSDAYQNELPAIAPLATGNPMMTRLGRENTMFSTRAKATGGSQTAENLEDAAAQRIDPGVVMALITGHPVAAAGNLARNTLTNLSGYTPAVRQRLAQLLLMSGQNPAITGTMSRVERDLANQRARAAALLRGALSGNAQATAGNNRSPSP